MPLEGDSTNLSGPLDVLRTALGNKPGQRVYGREALVASAYGAATRGLQVIQESLEQIG
jgi:hypothetical protein